MLQAGHKGEAVVSIMRRLRSDFLAEANGALVGAVRSGKVSGRKQQISESREGFRN